MNLKTGGRGHDTEGNEAEQSNETSMPIRLNKKLKSNNLQWQKSKLILQTNQISNYKPKLIWKLREGKQLKTK